MAITDPRDISGLVAWFSAEAETGYTDGQQMTGWTDLSGNGNDATAGGITKPMWQATTGPGGGPAIRFGGSGWFTLPNLMSGATSGEVMAYIKADADGTHDSSPWAFGKAETGNQSHYPFVGDGKVYEAFGGVASQRKSFTPSLAINSWRRYNVASAASSFLAALDETAQVTSATARTVSWTTGPRIGLGEGAASPNKHWGYFSALVLYNRELTTTERSDLATWLAANPSGGTIGGGGGGGGITVAGEAAVAAAVALETSSLPILIAGEAAAAAATALDGSVLLHTDTLTDNQAGGVIIRGASIEPDEGPAVEPVPAGVSEAVLHDAIIAYPLPTMTDGRPT